MWIRSQDKEQLKDCNNLDITEYNETNTHDYFCNVEDDLDILGQFKSKKRALEVLDEIQFYVCKGRNDESDIYKMLENQKKLLRNIYDVYEMPKE